MDRTTRSIVHIVLTLVLAATAVAMTLAVAWTRADLAVSAGTIFLSATAALALLQIRDWLVDHRRIQARCEDLERDRTQYLAARATLDAETDQLRERAIELDRKHAQTIASERAALKSEFDAEREAMYDRLAAERGEISRNSYERGILHGMRGFTSEPDGVATVLRLPTPRDAQYAPESGAAKS